MCGCPAKIVKLIGSHPVFRFSQPLNVGSVVGGSVNEAIWGFWHADSVLWISKKGVPESKPAVTMAILPAASGGTKSTASKR